MNIEELQEHIDFVQGERDAGAWHLQGEEVNDVLEAARRYANPNWWIEREHGKRVAGPFTTDLDANRARVWVEKVTDPETFWIRQLAALTPGDQVTAVTRVEREGDIDAYPPGDTELSERGLNTSALDELDRIGDEAGYDLDTK